MAKRWRYVRCLRNLVVHGSLRDQLDRETPGERSLETDKGGGVVVL